MADPGVYILTTKHGFPDGQLLFWAPNSCGYTTDIDGAGLYSRWAAEKIVEEARGECHIVTREEADAVARRHIDASKLRDLVTTPEAKP